MSKSSIQICHQPDKSVTLEQVRCFVRQLCEDLQKANPLYQWQPDTEAGTGAYYTNTLTKGGKIQIHPYSGSGQRGILMRYYKNDEMVYTATEAGGDPADHRSLAHLHRLIATAVRKREITDDLDRNILLVGDIFRAVSAESIVDALLNTPSMLSFNISANSFEWNRRKELICATLSYIQHVSRKPNTLSLDETAVKRADGTFCGHLATIPIAHLANARTTIPDTEYGGLHPAEKHTKFVADTITNLILGL